tara:strand:- start:7498 stop:8235 length:738 start_codon:yes stop_codon:yes gene_type:complete
MLKAVVHGKAGRVDSNGDGVNQSWRQLFKSYEDLLTAAVFTRWGYLSGESQSHLVRSWLNIAEGETKHDLSLFEGIHFWPKYELREVEGRSFVEPDVLIEFKTCDLLVEVKPPNGGDQYLEQWKNEIEGYRSQAGEKDLYFLAIGRVDAEQVNQWRDSIMTSNNPFKPVWVNGLKWKPVAESIYELHGTESVSNQDRRILSDILEALQLYGVRGIEYSWEDFLGVKRLPSIDLNRIGEFGLALGE